jgi:class 3 adenylate cyclase
MDRNRCPPCSGLRSAIAISKNLRPLGIEVRFGLHTGEVEFSNGEVHGIAVNTTARIAAIADASEILVSRTVKDLVAGSGIHLAHHGQHRFKGLAESMDVYSVEG